MFKFWRCIGFLQTGMRVPAAVRAYTAIANPRSIHEYLDRHVIGQSLAKKTLAVAMSNHCARVSALQSGKNVVLEKANVLLVGPSGCGKTLLAKQLADSCQLPFTIFDCSGLVSSGYIGSHSDDIVSNLFEAAHGNKQRAETGVVILDEIDKLKQIERFSFDIGGTRAQNTLLKLIEGTTAKAAKTLASAGTTVDTTNVLFVGSGAFVGLEEIIHTRLEKERRLASGMEKDDPRLLMELLPEDLIKYGMIPELVGRIPVMVPLDALNQEMLFKALVGDTERSLLKQYQWIFWSHGVQMGMSQEAANEVVQQTIKQKTGARGLKSIMERCLLQAMYDVPESDITGFVLTEQNVRMEAPIEYQRKPTRLNDFSDGTPRILKRSDGFISGSQLAHAGHNQRGLHEIIHTAGERAEASLWSGKKWAACWKLCNTMFLRRKHI